MKKLILSLALVLAFSTVIFAQSNQEVKTMRKNTSHWSIGAKGGLDYFRVMPRATGETTMKKYISQGGWSFGAFVDYAVNPYYSIGLEGSYFTYNRGVNGNTYKGNTIDVVLMNSINMSNVLTPYRSGGWRFIDFYFTFGLGAGFYTFQTPADADYVDRQFSALGVGGIDIEFNVSKSISLLLEGQYRYYTKPNLGGTADVTSNDALAVNIGLRWKIGAAKKDHVRNMIPSEYYPAPVEEIIIERIIEITDEDLVQRVNELENSYSKVSDENNNLKKDYNDLRSRLYRLENEKLYQLEKELEKLEALESVSIAFENIEFEFNSYNLTNNAKNLLNQIITILNANKNWNKIIISGHTDNVGSAAANKEISKKRADAVKDYFVSNGIAPAKLTTVGYGFDKPVATNTTPEGRAQNRRVEFEISK
ncbi:MAG: OmpA family protein [Bacteroidales bacterium]|jgi:outer membrane protein OmpA-like peptidoglycan-associated protein|nr:OmpA family protein [Bacteroidales bacterium]